MISLRDVILEGDQLYVQRSLFESPKELTNEEQARLGKAVLRLVQKAAEQERRVESKRAD